MLLNNSRQIQHKLQEQDRHFSRQKQKHSLSAMSGTNPRERPSSMFRVKSSSLVLHTISTVAPGGLQTEALCCQLQQAPWLLNPEHQLKSSGKTWRPISCSCLMTTIGCTCRCSRCCIYRCRVNLDCRLFEVTSEEIFLNWPLTPEAFFFF